MKFMNEWPTFHFQSSTTHHDRVLLVQGQYFYVESDILSINSQYFQDLFTKDKNFEIELKDFDSNDFENYLQAIYPTGFIFNGNNIIGLVNLSYNFMSPSLNMRCKRFLKYNLDKVDNLIGLLKIFFAHGDDFNYFKAKIEQTLFDKMIKYIIVCQSCHTRRFICEQCDNAEIIALTDKGSKCASCYYDTSNMYCVRADRGCDSFCVVRIISNVDDFIKENQAELDSLKGEAFALFSGVINDIEGDKLEELVCQGADFTSFAKFEFAFKKWQIANLHPMKLTSDQKGTSGPHPYRQMEYSCIQRGKIVRIGETSSTNNCPASLKLLMTYSGQNERLRIISLNTKHRDHEVNQKSYRRNNKRDEYIPELWCGRSADCECKGEISEEEDY